jgi:hypothetical protein
MKSGIGKGSGKFSQDRNIKHHVNMNFKGNVTKENKKFIHKHQSLSQELANKQQ